MAKTLTCGLAPMHPGEMPREFGSYRVPLESRINYAMSSECQH